MKVYIVIIFALILVLIFSLKVWRLKAILLNGPVAWAFFLFGMWYVNRGIIVVLLENDC